MDCEGHGPAPTLNDPEGFEFGAVAYPSKLTFPGTFNARAALGKINQTKMERIWNKHKQSNTPLKRKVFVATYTNEGLKFQMVLGPLKFEPSKRGRKPLLPVATI